MQEIYEIPYEEFEYHLAYLSWKQKEEKKQLDKARKKKGR